MKKQSRISVRKDKGGMNIKLTKDYYIGNLLKKYTVILVIKTH